MTAFACKSRDASGNVVERTIDADSRREALRTLEQGGLSPIEIRAVVEEQRSVVRATDVARAPRSEEAADFKLKRKALRRFTVQLGSSLKAGVPIHMALRAITDQADDPRFSAMMRQVLTDIEGGLPLSEAMRGYPRAFPEMYTGIIEAGEKSGTLDDMLDDMVEYLEGEMEMRADVRTAVMYPTFVMGTLCLAVCVLVFFVVPRFASFYSGFGADLPLPTRVLIASSELVQNQGLLLVGISIVLAAGAGRLARLPAVRLFCDRQLRRIPYVGRMIETATTLQIAQMLTLFIGSGLPLLTGLETIASAVRSPKSKKDLRLVAAGIETGATLAEGLQSARCLSSDARQMISTGEQTGSLQQACGVIADQHKKELKYLTKNVATFIEPVLTLCLAVVVLFVALAAFLPMWDLVRVVRQ